MLKMPDPVAWRYMHEGQVLGIHPRQIHRYYSLDNGETFVEGEPLVPADQLKAAYRQGLADAAKACDEIRDDAKEVEALTKFNLAMEEGPERDAVARGEFWLTVSTFNAGLKRAAAAIRLLDDTDARKGE